MKKLTTAILAIVICGCGQQFEGDEPLECEDGADNDNNGLFDCDDEGCAASPACQDDANTKTVGGDADTDADADADADADTDTDTDTDGTTTTITQFAVTVTWTDDGNVPTDTDGDSLPDVGCGDSVQVSVSDPLGETQWAFGMSETGMPNGWTGEDCYVGYLNFNYCHLFNGTVLVLQEVTTCSVMDIVPGSRTYFSADKDPFLTYYLEDSLGNCFIWGEDPTYYGPLNCTWI